MEAPVLKYFPVPSFLISKKSSEIIQLNDKAADLTGLEAGSLSGIKITNFLKTKFQKAVILN